MYAHCSLGLGRPQEATAASPRQGAGQCSRTGHADCTTRWAAADVTHVRRTFARHGPRATEEKHRVSVSYAVPSGVPLPGSDLKSDYAAGALSDFFQVAPGDTSTALGLRREVDREALAAAIRPHALRLGAPPPVLDSLERLSQAGSMAVVTGQQAGLLLGPMYTLSKAMTAISLAGRLDSEGRPVVPVFWVASQDHDVAEVDHAYLLDAEEQLHRTSVDLPDGVPVGRIPYAPEMLEQVRGSLSAHRPSPARAREVLALLEESATVARTYSDWFAAQLYRLLGRHGIVIVDPLEPAVASLSAQVIRREVMEPMLGPERVNAAGKALKAMGHDPQLGRGDGATNLFIELPGEGGLPARHLLRAQRGGFAADGRLLDRAELLERLDTDPTVLTPAAGLRPVVQDALLPTAVAVLGPGELAYVAQLRGVYELHDVPMPLAWPRSTVTVLEPAAARMLEAIGSTAASFVADPEAVLQRVLLERHGSAAEFERATATLEREFAALLAHVDGIDPTLRGTVQRGRRYLEATIDRLRTKSGAALARRDGETRRQFDRLRSHLLPLGQPAERVLSPYSHMLKFGVDALLDRLEAVGETGAFELRL